MDLPIGYPIFVSPLQTSFLDRHIPFSESRIGKITNPMQYISLLSKLFKSCAYRCQGNSVVATKAGSKDSPGARLAGSTNSLTGGGCGQPVPIADELDSDDEDFWKPIWVGKQVVLTSEEEIFYHINEQWLKWPTKSWLNEATRWGGGWTPCKGTTGEVIHEWRPFHIKATSRSHIDKLIVLVRAAEGYLFLIKEQGVQEI